MNIDNFWQKIAELAIMFYNYVMTHGESNFMFVNSGLFDVKDVPKKDRYFYILNFSGIPEEARYFFIGSFIVMVLFAIFACDSFKLFNPIEGIHEWKSKISIVKVVTFAAAIFSFHTFYKMLVGIIGGFIGADASIRTLDIVGLYINPIAIMIYAFAICTMTFRRKWFQVIMLGLAIFLTPSAMLFYGFTNEHISIYVTAGLLALAGGIIYAVHLSKKCSPFLAYFVLAVVYFVCKYYMIYYSDQVSLISAPDLFGRIKQYFACVQMDMIFTLLLLLILFVYMVAITNKINIKKNVVFPSIFLVFTVLSTVFGKTELRFDVDYKQAVSFWEDKKYEEAMRAFSLLNNYKDSKDYTNRCIEKIYNEGIELIKNKKYEKAIAKLTTISDYRNANRKIIDCKRTLNSYLAGIWHGNKGMVIVLNEDESCNYLYSSNGGSGSWYVDEDHVIHIYLDELEYSIYADLEKGYKTKSMTLKSYSSSWEDEKFSRVSAFKVKSANNLKLVGTWEGEGGSVLKLKKNGACYYIDGSGEEGPGTWHVDDQAMIRIDTDIFDYQLYGLLTNGYKTSKVLMQATGSSWNDEEFIKK